MLPAADVARLPAHVRIEQDGWLYEFDALRDAETLTETGAGGAAVDRSRDLPHVTARLRRALAASLGVRDLRVLVEVHAPAVDALRRLGYL